MGRCYEFGLAIHDGCEETMAVPPEGGKCVCQGCGTECRGRFAACAEIISSPGYIPLLAPVWARPGVENVQAGEASNGKLTGEATNGTRAAAPVAVAPGETAVGPPSQRRTDREQRLVERTKALTASLARLRTAVEEVSSELSDQSRAVANLSTQLSDQSKAIEQLTDLVNELGARLDSPDARGGGNPRSLWRRP